MRRDGIIALEIRRNLGKAGPIAACVMIGIALALIPLLINLINFGWGGLAATTAQLGPIALLATGMLTSGAAWTAMIARKAVVARDAVVKAMGAYQKATENAASSEEIKACQAAVETAELKVAESQIALESAIESQAQAASAFAQSTPIERLKAFVREKAAHDGAYRSRQGLIGTIRRDFADLADLMTDDGSSRKAALDQANAALEADITRLQAEFPDVLTTEELNNIRGTAPSEPEARPFDRIVLYIDDLDRCPAATVVEVLQAVHLLMAFRLFVVMVAVDVRWLQGALAQRYAQFEPGEGQPAATEYLEKIFQLAVWTQPFEDQDAGAFIRGRLLPSPPSGADEARHGIGDDETDRDTSAGKELEHALTPPSAGKDEEDAKSAQPDSVPDRTDTENA